MIVLKGSPKIFRLKLGIIILFHSFYSWRVIYNKIMSFQRTYWTKSWFVFKQDLHYGKTKTEEYFELGLRFLQLLLLHKQIDRRSVLLIETQHNAVLKLHFIHCKAKLYISTNFVKFSNLEDEKKNENRFRKDVLISPKMFHRNSFTCSSQLLSRWSQNINFPSDFLLSNECIIKEPSPLIHMTAWKLNLGNFRPFDIQSSKSSSFRIYFFCQISNQNNIQDFKNTST